MIRRKITFPSLEYYEEICFLEAPWKVTPALLKAYIDLLDPKPYFAYCGPATWNVVAAQYENAQGACFGSKAIFLERRGCLLWLNPFAEEGRMYFFPNCTMLSNIKYPEL